MEFWCGVEIDLPDKPDDSKTDIFNKLWDVETGDKESNRLLVTWEVTCLFGVDSLFPDSSSGGGHFLGLVHYFLWYRQTEQLDG